MKAILITIMLTAGLYAGGNASKRMCVFDMEHMNKNLEKYGAFKKGRYLDTALNSAINGTYSCEGEAKELCVKIATKLKSIRSK